MATLAALPVNQTGVPRRHLGEMLLAAGLVTPEQLQRALEEQARTGARLGETLVALGHVSEEQLARFLAQQAGLPYVPEGELRVEEEAARLLPEQAARAYGVLPVRQTRDEVVVAVTDPVNTQFLDGLHFTWNRRVRAVVVTPGALARALDAIYGRAGGERDRAAYDRAAYDGGEPDRAGQGGGGAAAGEGDNAAARLADGILAAARELGASDVHLEPFPDGLHVRCRVDGLLRPLRTLTGEAQATLVNRFKLMAGLDISERRLPQDGRFRWEGGGSPLDVRASTLPTVHGEKVVLRLLDPGRVIEDLGELGFLPEMLERYRRAVASTAGIFLVTGPTGSGKTTTLIATLCELRSPEKNLVTIEDPVEYEIPGVNQVQVNVRAGMTFAAGLRAILRQDPDIVMVGEIRDGETAETALRAALTGHLVLSTLHANDAAGAITRLLDIGIEPYLVAAGVIGSLAQRLARRLCPACRQAYELAPDALERAVLGIGQGERVFYAPRGCPRCGGTGYRGRVPLFELLVLSQDMRSMILRREGTENLRAAARAAGSPGLVEDGVRKAALGWTSLAEVQRVALMEV